MDVRERTPFAEIVEVAIIEKQLGDDVVGASVDFRFKMLHFDQSIRRSRVSLGKAGHADPKTALVRMRARFIESADKLHQVDRVLKRVARLVVWDFTRPAAPERKNISNRRLSVSK